MVSRPCGGLADVCSLLEEHRMSNSAMERANSRSVMP